MKRTHRWVAGTLAAGLVLTILPATGANASPEGRRNTALAATAAAGYLIYRYAQKPSTERLVPAAAAAGAAGYLWYNDGRKRRVERDRERAALIRYGRRTAYSGTRYRTAGYRSGATKHTRHGKRACWHRR